MNTIPLLTWLLIGTMGVACAQGPAPSVLDDPFQANPPDTPFVQEQESLELPPLRSVIDSALKYSPLLQSKARDLSILDQETVVARKKWMDYLYVEGSATYGVFNQVFTTQLLSESSVQANTLNQSAQGQYYAGVSVKMPISSILHSNNQQNIKRLEREQILWDQEQARQDLRKTIIKEYYTLRFFKESLSTFLETFETLHISYVKAQKDIENSRMKLDEFARIAAALGKAKNEYIKAKNDFYGQFELLELLAGTKLR